MGTIRVVDDLRAPFGRRVRALREERGLSQEKLAELANLHWTFLSGIERGRRNPGLNTLARLATALKIPLSSLVAGLADDVTPRTPSRKSPLGTKRAS